MKHQRKLWKGATPSLPSRPAAVESVRGPAKTGALEHKQFSKASSGRPARQRLCAGQQDAHSPFLLAHPQLTKGSLGLALKEAQAPPSFPLSFLPPPNIPQATGGPQAPHRAPHCHLGLQRPPTTGLAFPVGQSSCPWTFPELGEPLYRLTPGYARSPRPSSRGHASHCQYRTRTSICSQGAREDCRFPSSPASWAQFRGTLDFSIW